ncbi:hypothetical protein F4779DRAFT_62692 [Xylariaceae sp. FL0662B]|nr:hypothetical protein F4779DRAFT_62692 [Xylariaceae sp. FL0662B]
MASMGFEFIAASKPFRILVGADKKEFMMHAELLAHISEPLNALINNNMKESRDGVAEWPEVDEKTFVCFCQFAYTGDYNEPAPELFPATKDNPQDAPDCGYRLVSEKKKESEPEPEPAPAPELAYHWEEQYAGYAPSSAQTHRCNRLWDRFTEFNYVVPKPPRLAIEPPSNSQMTHTEVFLAHARLYVLADYYDIDALKILTIRKLHRCLVNFNLIKEKVDDIAALVEYSYRNTVDKGVHGDELRALLTRYIACKIETMWTSPYFQELLERLAELSKAIIGQMLERLD